MHDYDTLWYMHLHLITDINGARVHEKATLAHVYWIGLKRIEDHDARITTLLRGAEWVAHNACPGHNANCIAWE